MSWLKEYKSSLKLIEVEELLDLIFYRPLAFAFVKIIYPTNLTPNQITILALIVGVIGGMMIFFNTHSFLILAGILLIVYDVLDCSDGQLARLKKNGTPIGRILDGVADYVVTITAYLGVGFGFASNSNNPLFYWVLLVLAGGSNIVHAIAVDYYRNRFLDYALNRDNFLGDDLKEFEEEYNNIKKLGGSYFQRAILWIYLKYSNFQKNISKDTSETKTKQYDKNDFYIKNKKMIHLWTYIGPTTELTLLIIAAIINRLDFFIITMVVVVNIYAVILYIVQLKIDKSTKLAETF